LDDAATAWNNGKAFTSAIDPIAMALMNAKLPDGSFLIPSAQSTAPYLYGVPNVNLIGTSMLAADQATASIDYDMTKADRISAKYYYQTTQCKNPTDILRPEVSLFRRTTARRWRHSTTPLRLARASTGNSASVSIGCTPTATTRRR
jgi:hypothetical protein